MSTGENSVRAGIRRVLLTLLGLVVAVAVVVVGLLAWAIHDLTTVPKAPDAAGLARSAETREARERAVAFADEQTARLRAAAPWAEVLDSSVADRCHAEARSGSFGGKPAWSGVTCRRTTVLYAAFDGEIEPRLAELDGAAAGLGWKPRPDGRTLVQQLRHMHSPGSDATAEQTAEALARPNAVGVDHVPGDGRKGIALTVAVMDGKGFPSVNGSWDDRPSLSGPDAKPYLDRESERVVYFDWRRVGAETLKAKAYAGHRYLMAIGVSQVYASGCPGAECNGVGPDW
ncbi:hypothetical protein [Streptomyces sp. CB01881]|uniref:hypothetical protein n=1 Tax=Streptomyces sp. CB01881 TaxID=2078691 RepID=UPI0011E0294D|nr:hypothetical protein [Streptomyces sp. CB01881]TYC73557.1 hypothetical protein EH183_15885 [Streptomyces sp. CB01881]